MQLTLTETYELRLSTQHIICATTSATRS